jgi:hypothetical protein
VKSPENAIASTNAAAMSQRGKACLRTDLL